MENSKEKIMIEEDAARCRNREDMARKAFKLAKQLGKSNLPTAAGRIFKIAMRILGDTDDDDMPSYVKKAEEAIDAAVIRAVALEDAIFKNNITVCGYTPGVSTSIVFCFLDNDRYRSYDVN
jgi:hypothetical protein